MSTDDSPDNSDVGGSNAMLRGPFTLEMPGRPGSELWLSDWLTGVRYGHHFLACAVMFIGRMQTSQSLDAMARWEVLQLLASAL